MKLYKNVKLLFQTLPKNNLISWNFYHHEIFNMVIFKTSTLVLEKFQRVI